LDHELVLYQPLSCRASSDDSFSSPESSWIEGATYESENGSMILETDSKDYEFIGVPIEVWREFKSAPSKGEYYHENIRGRYQR
jgi:hypothetical protein